MGVTGLETTGVSIEGVTGLDDLVFFYVKGKKKYQILFRNDSNSQKTIVYQLHS